MDISNCQQSSLKLGFVERSRCPVCESGRCAAIYEAPYARGPVADFVAAYYGAAAATLDFGDATYRLDQCAECGFIFQRHVLDSAGSALLYEHIIDPAQSLAKRTKAQHRYFRNLAASVQTLQSLFPERLPGDIRVLDFGMGWGHWVLMAKAHGFDACGAELSEGRIAYATSQGLNVVRNVAESTSRFDVISLDQVLEHVDDPGQIVKDLVGLLAPGGVLRVFVPNGAFLNWRIRFGIWRPGKDAAHPLEHINSFKSTTLRRLAARHGLRPVSLMRFSGYQARLRAVPRFLLSNVAPSWFFEA